MSGLIKQNSEKFIDMLMGVDSYEKPASTVLVLFNADPGDPGGSNVFNNEVNGGGYDRQTFSFTPLSNGISYNSSTITFPTATSDWGVITHVGVIRDKVNGFLDYSCILNPARIIRTGDTFSISANSLSVQLG